MKAIKDHPSYNSNTMDNDFSLLELVSPAPISSTVGIACLPPDVSQTFVGTTLTISGWGTIASVGSQSPDLKVGTVVGMSNSVCNAEYGSITANMICAGTPPSFDTDTCQGDSGGKIAKDIHLMLIFSFSRFSCEVIDSHFITRTTKSKFNDFYLKKGILSDP